jgi:hypothetical protein
MTVQLVDSGVGVVGDEVDRNRCADAVSTMWRFSILADADI